MIWFSIVVALAFIAGALFGATAFHDWLHGVKQRREPRPRYVFPAASIVSTTDWRKLDLPPMKRRQRMQVIDVAE